MADANNLEEYYLRQRTVLALLRQLMKRNPTSDETAAFMLGFVAGWADDSVETLGQRAGYMFDRTNNKRAGFVKDTAVMWTQYSK